MGPDADDHEVIEQIVPYQPGHHSELPMIDPRMLGMVTAYDLSPDSEGTWTLRIWIKNSPT